MIVFYDFVQLMRRIEHFNAIQTGKQDMEGKSFFCQDTFIGW
jgi:hypothetical protein